MARKFLTPVDLSQLEILNARIQNLSTTQVNAIQAPMAGQLVYDTTVKSLKVYLGAGSGWAPVGSVTTGSGFPTTAPSAIGGLYLDLTNLVLYLAKGTQTSSDWVPTQPYGTTGEMQNLGTANSAGTSLKTARIDHVHRHTDADHASIKLSALAAPDTDVTVAGNKITNLADPIIATDAANKRYVDNAVVGIDWKPSVRATTTANITLTGTKTIDAVVLVAGDRILVKDQTEPTQNGIYVVASGAWSRATDADTNTEVTSGFAVFIEEGNTYADTGWVLNLDGPTTLGNTPLSFIQFTGLGSILAGDGLNKSGNVIKVQTASDTRIVVNPTNIDLAQVDTTSGVGSDLNITSAVGYDQYGRVTEKYTTFLDSDTFENVEGNVNVKDGGIANAQLANNSISVIGGTNITVDETVDLGGTLHVGITGQIAIDNGGTGASTAEGARGNLSDSGFSLPQQYSAENYEIIPVNSQATWTVQHGLGNEAVQVQVYDTSTDSAVEVDVTRTDVDTITINWVSTATVVPGRYRAVVVG